MRHMKATDLNHHPILEVSGLKKYFPVRRGFFQRVAGRITAVEDVAFQIQQGKTLGLVGESGCGKTTVARLILKLLKADGGQILFRGTDITPLGEKEMKPLRRQIQIVFQDPYGSLNPRMTVGRTLTEGLEVAGLPGGRRREERLEKLLRMVGLSPRSMDRYPHEFSGGQRQRIGIARALSVNPALIVCDEPVSALDVSIQAQIINLLNDLQDQLGLSYLFISHDLNVVGYLCTDVAVMYRGRIMEYAPADALFDNPRHPYTHLLLSAVPAVGAESPPPVTAAVEALPDAPESLSGCCFLPRCPLGDERCAHTPPVLETVAANHRVRCWKAGR